MKRPKYPKGFDMRRFMSQDTPHEERIEMARTLSSMYSDDDDMPEGFQPFLDGRTLNLYLYNPIFPWMGVSAPHLTDALNERKGQYDAITVHINSPGGDTFEAIAMRNRLLEETRNGIQTRSVIEAYCGSAATLIALACTMRDAYTDSFYMIHKSRGIAFGTDDELERRMLSLRQTDQMAAKIYANAMKVSEDEALTLMKDETTYNAESAKEAGLIENVLDGTSESVDDDDEKDEETVMLDDRERARLDAETQIWLTAYGKGGEKSA